MNLQQQIEESLTKNLTPRYLLVVNESHMHSVPANSETHFKVTLVSDIFEQVSRVARHQKVYQALAPQMEKGIHALALHLYTAGEWEKLGHASPESPNCMGGSKRRNS